MDDFNNDSLFIWSHIRSLLDLKWVVRKRVINLKDYCSHENILRQVLCLLLELLFLQGLSNGLELSALVPYSLLFQLL